MSSSETRTEHYSSLFCNVQDSAWRSRCSVNVFIKVWSANQYVSTSVRCSHSLQVSHQLHYSWQKKQLSLWFLVFLSLQGHPQVFFIILYFTGHTICYLLELGEYFFSFFPHLFISFFFPPDFTDLPRNGVVQSQIRVLLPRNSMKDLRASENYPTYGGSCSLLPECIHIHKGQEFQLKEHWNLLNIITYYLMYYSFLKSVPLEFQNDYVRWTWL